MSKLDHLTQTNREEGGQNQGGKPLTKPNIKKRYSSVENYINEICPICPVCARNPIERNSYQPDQSQHMLRKRNGRGKLKYVDRNLRIVEKKEKEKERDQGNQKKKKENSC